MEPGSSPVAADWVCSLLVPDIHGVAASGDPDLGVSIWRYRERPPVREDATMAPPHRRGRRPAARPARSTVRDTALPDALLTLDAQFTEILGLLDRAATVRRMV